ncbi:MAG: hypothetical protein HY836_09830 [Aquabacterium sp.]|uniref:hypothetical protein n=1 Tax=Aquabacterium sp. TaxID=1872578 RepID=UPI0025BAAE26|nr:hypothetical protein [Aquabacterium sp.]MBI5925884.1 hypothetical protein [Aquabacterium sp.]
MKVAVIQQVAPATLADAQESSYRVAEIQDQRARFGRAFPGWMQPAITWISGKALPGQHPLMPHLCTPMGKVFAAAWTLASGVALGVDALRVFS